MKLSKTRKRHLRPKRHLVLFTRAPRLGQVKRRLARTIGPLLALHFHRGTTAALLKKLNLDPRFSLWLAVTPDGAGGIERAWPEATHTHVIPQRVSDLGQRMGRIFRELPPGPVVLIGTDIPELTIGDIQDAFRALADHDAVFGPSPDGGYWLVGFRRTASPFYPFRHVRFSSSHALADTLANLKPSLRIAMVAMREDVDDEASYRRWKNRGRKKPNVF